MRCSHCARFALAASMLVPVPAVPSAQTLASEMVKLPVAVEAGDVAGSDVDIDGPTAVCGLLKADYVDPVTKEETSNAGAVKVFRRSGAGWLEEAHLTAPTPVSNSGFANVVALSGDTLLVGAHSVDTGDGPGAGAAFVYVRVGTTWQFQATLVAEDAEAGDSFGWSVDVFGDLSLIHI